MANPLDELARSLAEPMTRGRAIKVLAGAFVATVAPGAIEGSTARARVRITRRRAASCTAPGDTPCGSYCCFDGDVCADPATGACCPANRQYCRLPHDPYTSATCCGPGEHCAQGVGCCGSTALCGTTCCVHGGSECVCPKGQVCLKGSCGHCPHGKHKCGDKKCCNPHTEKCCANTCCKNDQGCCGEICCDKGQKCCPGEKICCFKNETCCGDDCCDKHHQCSLDSTGHQVCCPHARAANPARGVFVCCPEGYVVDPSGDRCCPASQPNCPPCTPSCDDSQICLNDTCVSLPGA